MASLRCFFVSDLHGQPARLDALWTAIRAECPAAVFIGGDLLPSAWLRPVLPVGEHADPVTDLFGRPLRALRDELGGRFPRVFVIMGNDDPRVEEPAVRRLDGDGVWDYVDRRRVEWAGYQVFGYACVPPTPFLLKDWERYDVSRFVDPGSISPEDGARSVPADPHEIRWSTIQQDLSALTGEDSLDRAVFLFHAPPYGTLLDWAALSGRMVDGVPLDVHVGSLAVRRMIDSRQPLLTLHGHVHEAARLTGAWHETLGRTLALSAAHDGPELALVRFDLCHPSGATRELVTSATRR